MPHEPNWKEMGVTTGSDKQKEAVDAYDANYGKYADKIDTVPVDDKLATAQMPKAPDPAPFVVGPQSTGGR